MKDQQNVTGKGKVDFIPLPDDSGYARGEVLPIPPLRYEPMTEQDWRKVNPPPRHVVTPPKGAPNVVIVLLDQLAYADPDLAIEFVDQLELNNLVVVDNSVGGYAACRLAIERPEHVAGVVLVNTGGFTPHSVFTRGLCAVMGRPAVIKAVTPLSVRAYMRAKNPTDRAIVDRVVARSKTTEGARTAAALWKSFTEPGHELRERASEITAPGLITWGAKDLTAPKRWGKAVHAAIPESRFDTLPTGHVVFSSEPAAWLGMALPFVDAAHGVRKDLPA